MESTRTAYFLAGTTLKRRRNGHRARSGEVVELPMAEGGVVLQRGDMVRLAAQEDCSNETPPDGDGIPLIPCTLPQVFAQVGCGERIWFDDGRIGGIVRRADATGLDIEIVQARPQGEKLRSDKGINLPDSILDLPALTDSDLVDLAAVAELADMVGLSFAQNAGDVDMLRRELRRLGRDDLGIVLKIETRRGFENLPELLYAAMAGEAAGIMIARGDLAVECGYERLAEVQEEILWAAEAAHMPVIWATQVLETLAKTGLPSRAEITDAAMGERAECVMLNKGPHITDAIRTLDDILRRMQAHQDKKRPLLRALKAWAPPP